MLLVIDNYDSFTFNLVQYLGELAPHHPIAADLQVHRNDALTLAQIRELKPDAILLSPGPGDPDQSGVCLDVLRDLSPPLQPLGFVWDIRPSLRCMAAASCVPANRCMAKPPPCCTTAKGCSPGFLSPSQPPATTP